MTAYDLDRSYNEGEDEREARLYATTPTSRAVEWGRDVWMMMVAAELAAAGFTEAIAYNVPGTDDREFALLGPDSPGEYCYRFNRSQLGRHNLDDLARDVIWFIRMAGIRYRQALKEAA